MAQLAYASELSNSHLSSVEHGLATITIQTIDRLARGLNLLPLYLLTFPSEDERAHSAELIRSLPMEKVRNLRRQLQIQLGLRKKRE